jgi:hypothetical protein
VEILCKNFNSRCKRIGCDGKIIYIFGGKIFERTACPSNNFANLKNTKITSRIAKEIIAQVIGNDYNYIGYNWESNRKYLFRISQSTLDNNALGNRVDWSYWHNFTTKELLTLFTKEEIDLVNKVRPYSKK